MYVNHSSELFSIQDDCKRGIIEIPVCTDADVGGRHKTWKGLPGPEGKGLANNSVGKHVLSFDLVNRDR